MNTKQYVIVMLAVVMVLGCIVVTSDSISGADPTTDSTSGTTTTTPSVDDGEDTEPEIASVKGNCGSGGATWEYDMKGELKITATSTNNKVVAGFDPTGTSWAAWGAPDYLDSSGKEVTGTSMSPKEVFSTSSITLSISGNAVISASAFEDFKITTISLSNCTSISSGAFKGCKDLTSVSLGTVATIGSSAFEGCTKLASIDINKATVDHTTFKGCTALKEIKATSSTTYTIHSSGVLLSDGGKTVFMCPTGLKPTSPVVLDSKVTKVWLDYADITYFVDLCRADGSKVTFETVSSGTDVKAKAVAYSSLGMEKATPSMSGTSFVLTYELYDGWEVLDRNLILSSGSATIDSTKKTITFSVSSGKGYTLLPMGVEVILTDSMSNVTKIQNWEVDNTIFTPKDANSVILKDVVGFSGSIVGYEGSATAVLGETLSYHGVIFDVIRIAPEPGSMSEIVDLTIEGNPALSDGTFANYTGLESVDMRNVQKIPAEAFRYCINLAEVNIGSCMLLGDYAFEGCSRLMDVTLASDKVEIGKGVFNNCGSLKYIAASMDTEIAGDTNLLVIHVSNTETGSLTVHDDVLIVVASNQASLDFSTSKDGTVQKVSFYKGGYASVDIEGHDEVYLKYNAGTPNTDCLVIFDSRLDVNVENQVVKSGSKLDSVPIPSKGGYSFKGWFDENGRELTEDTVFSSSVVFEAVWQKENPKDNTPTYVLVMFAVAIIGTVAVLAINRFR